MNHRIEGSGAPLLGGNYAGIWKKDRWVAATTNNPTWRVTTEGIAVGWLDPATAITIPPCVPAAPGGGV